MRLGTHCALRLAFVAACLAAPLLYAAGTETPVDFSREILPLLSDNCFYCHGPDPSHRKGGLRLDEESEAKKLVDGAAPIIAGKSAESEVYKRLISPDSEEIMPPPKSNKKLTPEQIALLKRWIDQGAPWGQHWSFTKPNRPPVPSIPEPASARIVNPIDAYVVARLKKEKLAQAPEAEKTTLIRRVTLDLTGVPPSVQEVDEFLADKTPEAYERLVDRLLTSPRYGERMAWDWMEAARYADTNGYQGDNERTMWPWRDWVVKAFNENMPYDQFTIWQLAGDLLPNATQEQKIATGFCRNYPINGEGGRIAEENRVDYVMDMSETAGTVWLGLTVGCCRCHDHKFDPLSQKDYFALFAFFNQTPVDGGGGDPQTKPHLAMPTDQQTLRLAELDREIDAEGKRVDAFEQELFPRPNGKPTSDSENLTDLDKRFKDALKNPTGKRSSGQFDELVKEFDKSIPAYGEALRRVKKLKDERNAVDKAIVRVMVMEDIKAPRKTYILDKGLYDKRAAEVTAATPAKLPPLPADAPKNRLGLAQWLVSPEQPLTARVTVNRFWQMFFGIGIVKTAEDFGVQAEFPSHPELLDWLATEFRDNGWNVKQLVKTIVMSHTYRQSSKVTPGLQQRDPENRLLARGPRFRMASWMIRDNALAASGLLVDKSGGPPVNTYQPSGIWEEATFGTKKYRQDHAEALYRRSLYVFWRRIVGPTMFFDTPSRTVCSVKPMRTNTPLHALSTLNDITYVEAARSLAEQTLKTCSTCNLERMTAAYRRVLARPPAAREMEYLQASLERLRREFSAKPDEANKLLKVGESKRDEKIDAVEHAAWTAVCLAILNLDEALTKE